MEEIWIVLAEVIALTDSAPEIGEPGFINVVCTGADRVGVELKVRDCLAEYNWQILDVQQIEPVSDDLGYDDAVEDLIEDVRLNPHHIRLGTLHTYKVN